MQCGCLDGKVRFVSLYYVLLLLIIIIFLAGGGALDALRVRATPAGHDCVRRCCRALLVASACVAASRALLLPAILCPLARPAGVLRSTLQGHRGMVMAVRWNRKGDLLLSGAARTPASAPCLPGRRLPPFPLPV